MTLGIFAEPTRREPRGKTRTYWAVCGDFAGGPEKECADRREAVELAAKLNAVKPRSVCAGVMEMRNGESYSWSPV